ncbi:MAG: hypothetical protein ACLQOO_35100 [Terriglobia bacterium]
MEAPRNESPESPTPDAVSSPSPESRAPSPGSSKRKYTTSEKSQAASRENLKKANLAPHELKYRLTPRRLAACFNALEKAVAELRRLDSPHYGLGFKRGTHCASLLRSLALAGEKREDYEEHLRLFHQAFPTVDERGHKLVQATAEAVWRRLRVFRGQGRWELYAVATLLVELITERERAAAEQGPQAGPSGSTGPVGTTGPVNPILDASGPDRAKRLGLSLLGLLMQTNIDQEARRLNLRIERLLRGLVPPQDGQPLVQDAPPHPSEASYDQKSAEVLGNPLRSGPQVEATLNQDREPMKGTDKWQKDGPTAGGPATGTGNDSGDGTGNGTAGGSDVRSGGCQNAADLALRGGLMRLLQRGGLGDFSRLEGPEGKALWTDLWLRAFGLEDETRNSKLENRGPNFDFGVSRSEVLAFAETTWERVQMFRRHVAKEEAQLRDALQARVLARQVKIADCQLTIDDCKTVATEPSAPSSEPPKTEPEGGQADVFQSSIDNHQSAIAVLGALAVYSCLGAMQEAGKKIEAAYYRVLVALYGDLSGFDYFKPKEPTMHDHLKKASNLAFEILSMKDGPLQRQKQSDNQWRGESEGPDPGGGP